jgi:hypothetical protein
MRCPVCAYPDMPYPPADYNICPCCGTEFGNDDAFLSVDQLRAQWLANGAVWFFGNPPLGWNPYLQLIKGNLTDRCVLLAVSTSAAPSLNAVATIARKPTVEPDYELVPA